MDLDDRVAGVRIDARMGVRLVDAGGEDAVVRARVDGDGLHVPHAGDAAERADRPGRGIELAEGPQERPRRDGGGPGVAGGEDAAGRERRRRAEHALPAHELRNAP